MNKMLSRLILLVFLTGCTSPLMQPISRAPSTEAPVSGLAAPQPTATLLPEKVVTLAAETPAPLGALDSATPTAPPFQLPKTLEELGIPATTYTDRTAGFAFDYPQSWLITDLSDNVKRDSMVYSITLRSGQPTPAPKSQDRVDSNITAIDVTIFMQGPKTLEQAVNERRAQGQQSETGQTVTLQSEEDWTLRGGLKAHRFLYNLGRSGEGGREQFVSELVTMVHDKMVLVSGRGDLGLYNVVSVSLRETE